MIESPLSDNQLIDGVLHIFPGEFNNEDTFYSVDSKTSLLYSNALLYTDTGDKLIMLRAAIKQYAGVPVDFHTDVVTMYEFIDCSEIWNEGVDGVIRFIFSNDSSFGVE